MGAVDAAGAADSVEAAASLLTRAVFAPDLVWVLRV